MSEETILKNSIFGGYKKEDVIKYIDSVSEENDKKVKDMEEQIILLTKENNKLKKQLAEEKNQPEVSGENNKAEIEYSHEGKHREGLSVRQQMELPEGMYLVSKDHSVINLPEPVPAYQTKEKSSILNSIEESKKEALHKASEEDETTYENVTAEIAATEQTGNNKNTRDGCKMEPTKVTNLNETAAYRAESASQKPLLSGDIKEIQAELISVKALLEKEKNEKQMLAAKLEFCNDLLLELYKK